MTEAIRWGILGTGKIAHVVAAALAALPDARLAAVGSRAADSADAFADEFGIPHRHASYEALADDADVDVVYVATPHPFHRDNSILCLEAGKAVLCEKPLTINAAEADELIAVAHRESIFLMEAMSMRFLPIVAQVRYWLAEGAVGDVRMVKADIGFRASFDPQCRLFDLELGGGSLLDIGIYPLSFVCMVLGAHPDRIEAMATMGSSGVDEQFAAILGYGDGGLGIITGDIRAATLQETCIIGTEGTIVIHPPYISCTTATLQAGGREERLELRNDGTGYGYQGNEVMTCMREGKLESDIMPLDESRAIMGIMDRLRQHWGLKYPME